MQSTDFRYTIHFKVNEANQKMIVLNQSPFFKGNGTEIQIPLDDIDSVIYSLKTAKDEANSLSLSQFSVDPIVEIEPSIVNTLVSLFLSGIPIPVLSNQYEIDEPTIRYNLESKGIILMDEI
ncbi:hypothetical protein [Flavobacterium capsici]|uniref:Uncharacterized protein n=1 Tax=Flavobacterium capsici TaxID=3075618 RepID=A0AA96J5Z8_9FLAO|nr:MULTISPECIES: hypothetical protein [unclassified Flavobacterium]WNM18131.1 hypothetical protein RN608_08905 [Flavobacterium sp. PMR2A8]WNM22183.1 hypothetical protein RN605_02205 [Flavobacterium sp. PMTSA4]